MKIAIHHQSPDCQSYRAACVKSLFNAESNDFSLTAELPLEAEPWSVGLVVGPSGSGKSSLGARIWGADALRGEGEWPKDTPIIDAIAPDSAGGDWQAVTAALSAVGLGDVPAWLRPYRVLSTGERFRAELARIVCEAPARVVIDEFTSVVDRQIARVGASAFAKAWRRTGGQAVLLSCHYDIIDWLAPDWIFDTSTGVFEWTRGRLRRPDITLDIYQTNWRYWPLFEPHHYLKAPPMIASVCYVAFLGGVPIAHIGMTTRPNLIEARAARFVVMPAWQGIGVGMAVLNAVCALWRKGDNPYSKPMRTIITTSHPGLAAALRRSPLWTQISARLYGEDKSRSARSIAASRARSGSQVGGSDGLWRAFSGYAGVPVYGRGCVKIVRFGQNRLAVEELNALRRRALAPMRVRLL